MTNLSVNLNRIALLRNSRNIGIPSVTASARTVLEAGAYGITVHPPIIVKKLPKYPIVGAVLIGKIAVADNYQGFGWGKLLIMDALYRSLTVSQTTGCFAVVVDAIDDEAVRFYQRFEFQLFLTNHISYSVL